MSTVLTTPLLDVESLSKSFPGQVALDGASLQVMAGQVHALVGQNGSGKSTLIKLLAGYHRPDPGSVVRLDGHLVDIENLSHAERARIHVMHQDLGLVPTLSPVENLALGRGYQTGRGGRIHWAAEERRVRDLLASFGVECDVRAPVSGLSAAERAIVALGRALQGWDEGSTGLLILDEPTASLPRLEVERLFAAVRSVVASGAGVVFVSHRLDEVFEIADHVTVLRDGKVAGSAPTSELDRDRLIELIVGRPIDDLYVAPPEPSSDIVMTVDALWGHNLRGIDLTVHKGEIVGVAGLDGSGREELAPLLFGAEAAPHGTVIVNGSQVTGERGAIGVGMALVPADRKRHGCIPTHTVRDNISLPRLGPFGRWWLSASAERADAQRWVDRVGLRPPDPERVVLTLSGGNQQKAVLARWLRTDPSVLVLDEPTQGVDVGAKAAIYELLADAARRGVAIVVCSSDAEELAHICDRVLVLRAGHIATELTAGALTTDRIVQETLS